MIWLFILSLIGIVIFLTEKSNRKLLYGKLLLLIVCCMLISLIFGVKT